MSLPDGEYELDLGSLLSDAPDTLAVKYGNVSGDLDLTKSLILYQTDLEAIVKGLDRENQPLIFEGICRGSGIVSNASEGLYYLCFGLNSVQLNRISDTLRVNKSRSVAKWTAKIAEWDPQRGIREVKGSRSRKIEIPAKLARLAKSVKPSKSGVNSIKSGSNPKTASKRPPKEESPIISESDFEDLDDGDLAGFPQFSFPSNSNTTSSNKSNPVIDSPPILTSIPGDSKSDGKPSKSISKPSAKPSTTTNISDDDFKDLEDQLQEVLDDESDEDEGYTGSAIVIEGDDPVKGRKYGAFEGRTPISLHSLVGKRRGDDLSSEEE